MYITHITRIVFSLRYLCCVQPQKGCLCCQHINPMESLNQTCQCSRGTSRIDSGCGYGCSLL